MGPGPSSANPAVLRAMSLPVLGYLDLAYFKVLDEVILMLKEVFKTEQRAFAVAGAGSAGMEAGLQSFLERGDKVIICSYGFFCERQVNMCQRLGAQVVELKSEWGKSFNPQQLSDALKQHPDTKLVVSIHAETSAGTLHPVKEMSEISHRAGALFMTDVVTSLGGCEVDFDGWDLDFAYAGSQKCLAAPPGISPVALSERGLDYVKKRKTLPSSWYLDLSLIADYWGPERKHHHTNPVNMVYGLREALALTLNEGLETRWLRHERVAAALRAGLAALGLQSPVDPAVRLNQLTVVTLPAGVNDIALRNQLFDQYGIEIGRGLGQFAGKVIRIGLMGESCVPANVFNLLNALERILPTHGYEVAKGAGAAAASAQLADQPAPLY
jgi:alanine-glyoxylate transaminase/serine-glyoxylate transaminase/serine-pyruvate transaminase